MNRWTRFSKLVRGALLFPLSVFYELSLQLIVNLQVRLTEAVYLHYLGLKPDYCIVKLYYGGIFLNFRLLIVKPFRYLGYKRGRG